MPLTRLAPWLARAQRRPLLSRIEIAAKNRAAPPEQQPPNFDSKVPISAGRVLGLLPAVSLTSAFGLLLIAYAYSAHATMRHGPSPCSGSESWSCMFRRLQDFCHKSHQGRNESAWLRCLA